MTPAEQHTWDLVAEVLRERGLDPATEITSITEQLTHGGHTLCCVRLRFWNNHRIDVVASDPRDKQRKVFRDQIARLLEDPVARIVLRGIGFWKVDDRSQLPDPTTFPRRDWNADERAGILRYLRSGHMLGSYLGYSWCRFRCGIPSEKMGSSDVTDNVWIWPEGLPHYIEQHDVDLPEAFIEHARQNDWQVKPGLVVSYRGFGPAFECSEWIEWSKHRG